MRKLLLIGLVGGSLWGGGWVKAEAPEKVRVTCDPAKQCPGKCRCVEATLEVTFDGDTQSILEVEGFTAGARVSAVVVLDTKSESIDGWKLSRCKRPSPS